MEYIAEAQGLWYEGSGAWLRLMQGHPIILPFSAPGRIGQMEHVFLEDYFNSTTRIRRGRLFARDARDTWAASTVSRHPHRDLQNGADVFRVNGAYKTATVTVRAGWEVVLGNNNAESHWIAVLSEKVGLDAHYLTLKSKTFLGVLPELIPGAMPEKNRTDILNALDAVVDAAPIQAPQPVIDACRVAVTHMLTARYPDANPKGEKELQKIISYIRNNHSKEVCTADAATLVETGCAASELVNRLHTRAKPNSDDTRAASQRDADLAVSGIAFLLQDFRWATVE
jgi:hypothetical protein